MTAPIHACTVCSLATTNPDAICASCRPLLAARRGPQRVGKTTTKARPRPSPRRRR